jgi:hypothetical protein
MANNDFTANQKKALSALLASPSVAAAARVCGLSEKTMWRYLADDGFKSELQHQRGDVMGATTTGLVASSQLAAETLHDLLNDDDTPATVKARVAQTIVELARKSIEDDVLERLERLEAAYGDKTTSA